jgi:pyruvate formate lyase activating enzyme
MMADVTPYIFKIQRYCLHDGPGIRTTLFFKGCPLACHWCHNPESQAMGQVPEAKNIDKLVADLVSKIERDRIFYDESGGGVTFSGGEPLAQPKLLLPLLAACREQEIHTCLDTAGFATFDVFKAAATLADLVLFDVKIMADPDHRAFTGKPVGLILENLKKLSQFKVSVKLRFPLVPTRTDTQDNIDQIIKFLTDQTPYRDVHILPFHTIGEGKYDRLKINNTLKNISPPTGERVEEVRQMFEIAGFNAIIGG